MKSLRLESQIKKSCNAVVKKIPIAKMFPYNPYYGEAGIPDQIGCLRVKVPESWVGREVGLFFGVEYKRPRKKLTDHQKAKKKQLKKVGGLVFRVSSIQGLRKIGRFLLKKYLNEGGAVDDFTLKFINKSNRGQNNQRSQ